MDNSFRRYLYLILCMGLLSLPAQAAAESKSILILDSQTGQPYDEAKESMLHELASHGFVEGNNLFITRRDIQNKVGLAKRWLRAENPRNFDVIFVNGTVATKAAMDWGYGGDKQFVFASVTDPVGLGVISEIGKAPFANFTGVPYGVPIQERLRFLKRMLPQAKVIGLIHTDMPQSAIYADRMKVILRQEEFSDLKVIFREVPFINTEKGYIRMSQIVSYIAGLLDSEVDVFMTPSDQFGIRKAYSEAISAASAKPLMGLSKNEVRDWAAHFALYPRQDLAGKKAGQMILGLFNGESFEKQIPDYVPGEYAVNVKLLDEAGITIPQALQQDKKLVMY